MVMVAAGGEVYFTGEEGQQGAFWGVIRGVSGLWQHDGHGGAPQGTNPRRILRD